MPLRNFYVANERCGGTRYTVTKRNSHAGKCLFIQGITLIPSDNQFLFQLWRRQFPIKLAFFFTVRKFRARLWIKLVCFYPLQYSRTTSGMSRWIGQGIQLIWKLVVKKQRILFTKKFCTASTMNELYKCLYMFTFSIKHAI